MFTSSGISATISATRLMFAAYNGYQKGKLAKSDQALREEVRRRTEEIRGQIDFLFSKAHRNKQIDFRNSLQDVIELCDQFISNARYGVSHNPKSKHDAAVKLNKSSLKLLIEHDFKTLESLMQCEQNVAAIMNQIENSVIESELCSLATTAKTILVESQRHFLQRNMIIDGL